MTNAAPTAIRQRLETLKPQVRAVANRHGTSDRRVYGSIATGGEHAASDPDLLGCSVDVTEVQTLHPWIRALPLRGWRDGPPGAGRARKDAQAPIPRGGFTGGEHSDYGDTGTLLIGSEATSGVRGTSCISTSHPSTSA